MTADAVGEAREEFDARLVLPLGVTPESLQEDRQALLAAHGLT